MLSPVTTVAVLNSHIKKLHFLRCISQSYLAFVSMVKINWKTAVIKGKCVNERTG
jgi:hypothetical protein